MNEIVSTKSEKECLTEIKNVLENKEKTADVEKISLYDVFLTSYIISGYYKEQKESFLDRVNKGQEDMGYRLYISDIDAKLDSIELADLNSRSSSILSQNKNLVYGYKKDQPVSSDTIFLMEGPENLNSNLYLANQKIIMHEREKLANLFAIKHLLQFYNDNREINIGNWVMQVVNNMLRITMRNEIEGALNKDIMLSLSIKIKNREKMDFSTCIITGQPLIMELLDKNEMLFLKNFMFDINLLPRKFHTGYELIKEELPRIEAERERRNNLEETLEDKFKVKHFIQCFKNRFGKGGN